MARERPSVMRVVVLIKRVDNILDQDKNQRDGNKKKERYKKKRRGKVNDVSI
jgi:hypothetical protein